VAGEAAEEEEEGSEAAIWPRVIVNSRPGRDFIDFKL
jgi:hypothetical protein